jgi:outer membrane protein OmpA-like peptidoglycan-associated protein
VIVRVALVLVLCACAGTPLREPEPTCAPEDVDGFRDEDGCVDPDNDQDAVLDRDDTCPCHPEDIDGFEDEDGCPDPDNDGDHFVDPCDVCPDEAETENGFEDNDGCADIPRIMLRASRIVIVQRVTFSKDSVRIPDNAIPILDAIAQVMADNPHIELVEVGGHASSGERNPAALAQHRADAVRQALIDRGVAAERLVAHGYSQAQPIAPNDTVTGRALNRRCEFVLRQTTEPPPEQAPPTIAPRCPDGPPPPVASVCE